MWLGKFWAIVRVVNDWQVDSWGLWCQIVAEVVEAVGRIGYVVVEAENMGCY
jgi:hypothetical protein